MPPVPRHSSRRQTQDRNFSHHNCNILQVLIMSSEQADAVNVAEGAPEQSLPSRPAKQPKEKKPAKGGKSSGLEVCAPPSAGRPPRETWHHGHGDPIANPRRSYQISPSSFSTDSTSSTRSRLDRRPKSLVRGEEKTILSGFATTRVSNRID